MPLTISVLACTVAACTSDNKDDPTTGITIVDPTATVGVVDAQAGTTDAANTTAGTAGTTDTTAGTDGTSVPAEPGTTGGGGQV